MALLVSIEADLYPRHAVEKSDPIDRSESMPGPDLER
jgi:hypothetical protein